MRTINSKKNAKDFVAFKDDSDKSTGFSGTIALYDSEVYVDTRDGTGYKEVIEKLQPLIHKLASRYHFNGNSIEDTRHDVIVHILEGIPKYNPDRNTKLSTFLEMRVNRRLINDIRNKSRISRNATYLNIGLYSITCKCGHNCITKMDEKFEFNCPECDSIINQESKKVPVNIPEVGESMLCSYEGYGGYNEYHNVAGEDCKPVDDEVIFMHDMASWLKEEDERVVKAIELIYFHDYTKSAAAREVGLTSNGLGLKLQELRHNPVVKEIFGR